METMVFDEMDPDHRSKRGREVIEDPIHEQTRREIKELREEIKELREQIRGKEREIEGVVKEIAIASVTEVRKSLEENLQFLRHQISSLDQQITSRDQQITILLQQISTRDQLLLQQISTRDQLLLQQISTRDQLLLHEKVSLRSAQEASAEPVDESHKWMECMSPIIPALPRNKADVTMVLFPGVRGKLPVTRKMYRARTAENPTTGEYLQEADDSVLTALVVAGLTCHIPDRGLSEMDTTVFVGYHLTAFFSKFKEFSPHKLVHTLSFNCSEKSGDSYSDVTLDKSRPDTLCVAFGRTLLVGEDKVKNLQAAEDDLRKKVTMLSPVYYGELEFILGYVAAGPLFQWVYVGKNGGRDLSLISPCLDLTIFEHKCKFFLSLGYAYHLLCSMADAVPDVPSNRALFSKDVHGDRTIDFFPEYVRKSVKNFDSNCGVAKTTVHAVRKAYRVAGGCSSLPQLMRDDLSRSGTYVVAYKPVGYSCTLRSEQDLRNVARCVCEALRVLHTNGLVHRDIRLENIVQTSQHQFVLIDLEAAAECPNEVREFSLRNWSRDTLDDGVYTKMSDMYQLGRLLVSMRECLNTTNAERFIQQLLSKNLSAEVALNDIWLSDPMQ